MIVDQAKTRTAVQSFRDIQVWKKSMDLALSVYRLTRVFPREEAFGLTAQVRRSAISIPSNLAEGHGRMNPREFKRFLLIARGSNSELQTQLELSEALGFGVSELFAVAKNLSCEVEKMLMALIARLRDKSG